METLSLAPQRVVPQRSTPPGSLTPPTFISAASLRSRASKPLQRKPLVCASFQHRELKLARPQQIRPSTERTRSRHIARAAQDVGPAAGPAPPSWDAHWEPLALLDSADNATLPPPAAPSSALDAPVRGRDSPPPPTDSPPAPSGTILVDTPPLASPDDATDDVAFRWSKHWYPVSLVEDLDPGAPVPFQLLGKEMVLWRDKGGAWRAHRDLCPHRLAPLSEGRIDERTGDLQCSYHGWTFRGDGSCSGIPQAETTGPEARASSSPRACVAVFPTRVSQGLLFVWPEEGNWEEALEKEPPLLPPDFEDREHFSTVTIQRDLFYGYDVLMENVSDPSHIDFAHHNVTGRRDRAKPLPFELDRLGPSGFTAVSNGNPRITTMFLPPCGAFSKLNINIDIPFVGRQELVLWICSFNIPMAPGKTRSIVCSARNKGRFLVPGDQWWQLYPRWLEHLTSNKIYDGDMVVLQGQEKALLRSGAGGDIITLPEAAGKGKGKGKSYGSLTFTPTAADRVVLAFRNWLRRFGGGSPQWDPSCYSNLGPLPSTVLSKEQMLDRLSQHTQNCSSCRGAYEGIKKAAVALWGAAAVLLALATLPADLGMRAVLAAAALGACGVGAYLKLVLEPQFVFVDYVHSKIP